jgi:hypothetical protein
MDKNDIDVMNLIYSIEFQVKQAIRNNKSIDKLIPAYFDAQYNYVMIQHKLFPMFYEEACTCEEAKIIVKNSWELLMKEMN